MYSIKNLLKGSNESQTDLSKSACDSLRICFGKSMKGDINITGDCILEGEFSGKMITDGKLIVSKTGKFNGSIYAENIIIEGQFEGTIICRSNFLAKNASKVVGQVNAANFEFEESVHFDGTINQINQEEFKKHLINRDAPKLNPKIELTNTFVNPVEHFGQNPISVKENIVDDSKIKVVKLHTTKKLKEEKLETAIQEPLTRQS